MRKFTKQDILGIRASFKKSRFLEETGEVAGRKFKYFLLSQRCNVNLPDFVVMAKEERGREYVLGISDSLPFSQRPYPLFHEFVEFMEIGADQRDRCVTALGLELEEVPRSLRPEYIPRRRNFFRNLIQQAELKPEVYLFSEQDFRELQKSLNLLERLRK